ncbi:MAG: hypothetical protein NVSMB9_03440 [Isosphaeraceae bacterium]
MVIPLLKKAAISAPVMLAVVLSGVGLTSTSAQTVAPPASNARTQTKSTTVTRPVRPVLDLNKATAQEMVDNLPGVGQATAKKIIAGRPYTSVNDLSRAGVSPREIEALRNRATVAPAAPARAMVKSRAVPPGRPGAADMPRTKDGRAPLNAPAAKVNLNTATAEQLQTLPGIGPVHARAIIAARPIRSFNQLEGVQGLGKARVDAIRDQVAFAAPNPLTRPATPPGRVMTRPAPGSAPAPTSARTAPATKPGARPLDSKSAARPATAPGAGGRVNINTATKEQLDALPGIGPVKAQAILDARPFATPEDIMKVRGIKEGEYSKIKELITVD